MQEVFYFYGEGHNIPPRIRNLIAKGYKIIAMNTVECSGIKGTVEVFIIAEQI